MSIPKNTLLAFGTAAALALVSAGAVRYANRVPEPVPASAPPDVFSAERAMRHVRFIAQSPHPPGSEAHARVNAYLVAELTQLGLAPQVQDVTGIGTRFPVAGRVRNVLARIPGTTPGGKAVLLAAHYDGVSAGPAASDDASGSAALLETLRALRAGPPLRNDVIALFSDVEEAGLLGAAAFVRDHSWAKDVAVVMNFEARGTHGPSLMFQTGDGNLDVVRALRAAPMPRATSLSTTVYRRLPNDTDLSELERLRTPALNFAFIHGVNRYHTAEDDVAHLDPASVQHAGGQMLALARRFADEPLPRAATPDAVFFNAPGLGLVAYPEHRAPLIAFGALVVVGLALARIRRREPRAVRDMTIGALVTLVSVALSAVAAVALAIALAAFHGARPLGGNPAFATPYAIGIALLVVAIVATVYGIARRWAGAASLHAGALLIWAVVTVALTFVVPGGSFLFVWPLFAVAAATAARMNVREPRVAAALTWLATIFALYIIVPVAYLMACVALGLDATGAGILAVLASLTGWLLAPHLEAMRGWHPVLAPMNIASAAAFALGLGLAMVRTNPAHPAGVSFVYAVDVDSSRAWVSGSASPASARTWVRQMLERATAGQTDHGRPAWTTIGFNQRTTFPAPLSRQVSAPTAVVVKDSLAGDVRHVTLRVRAAPGTRAIYVAPTDAAGVTAAVDGKAVDAGRFRNTERLWPLQLVAPPDSGFALTLTVRAGSRNVIGLMSRADGIPALEEIRIPQRAPGILPIQSGDATVAYRRVSIGGEAPATRPRR